MVDHTEKFDNKSRITAYDVSRFRKFEIGIVNDLKKFYIVYLKGCNFCGTLCDRKSVKITFVKLICVAL